MKSVEEIDKVFTTERDQDEIGSLIEIILLPGLETNIDNERKVIKIKPAAKLYFGMSKHMLRGRYMGFEKGKNIDDSELFFEGSDGYSFCVKYKQIYDFKVIKPWWLYPEYS